MDFSQIIGQDFLKQYFRKTIAKKRVPHTQLFVGDEGAGTLAMALAFANELLCKGDKNCQNKVSKIIHPDVHFVFPTVTKDGISQPCSEDFMIEWRAFLLKNPYAGLYDWMKHLEVANKQGMIRVKDANNIIKKSSLKPYEADYKVIIVWMIESMNLGTANGLLKVLEEPPEDTKFILIAQKTDMILPTILSRCQIHQFMPISFEHIKTALIDIKKLDETTANKIAHQANGSWAKALEIFEQNNSDADFQKYFITWVRIAFSAKSNKKSIQDLIKWSEEMATKGRESQKQFLLFALETFRQAMLINYQNKTLSYYDFSALGFELSKLAPFIHSKNIEEIYKLITDSTYYIERNANPKLIFLDLSIHLTKLLHRKEAV